MAYKLTVANYDRQANFERDLLLFHCSTHSITHSSRSQYASYGGRRRLSRMSSCELHSRSLAVWRTGACNLEIAHMCYAILRLCRQSRDCITRVRNLEILRMCNTISRLCKFPDCAEHIYYMYIHTLLCFCV